MRGTRSLALLLSTLYYTTLNEIKRAGSFALPARAISTKNKHLLVIYSIPTRGFTAAVSVFRGTPPAKPLECKFWLITPGALLFIRWADPTGGEPRLSCARIIAVSVDIIEMSPSFCSQMFHLRLCVYTRFIQTTKNPARLGRAGFEKVWFFFYLPASGLPEIIGTMPRYDSSRPRPNTPPWLRRS